nr:hypothetical protein [Tanacetum cinerariifolium]
MPENSGIANLALQGGSGEGYGSLPTDFGVVEGTKRGEKVYLAEMVPGVALSLNYKISPCCFFESLCEYGLQSQPLIMPENGGIANLALQGGSGEGYGSLPTDFRVVEGTKRGEKVYVSWAGKGV